MIIRTENLTKEYNGVRAVDELNLGIEAGDIFGFLGPNGAGKSTTILMLTGLIEPTGGRCFIDDIEVAKDPRLIKEMIGYLPEDVGFYSNMTAEENLDYFGRFYGKGTRIEEDARKRRIEELLELVQLDGVKKKAGEFSRGMNQRLGLAQALINDPEILFLDEPTANLDPEGVVRYRKLIKKMADDGKTIFVSSHILSEVAQVCKTIGIITSGKLVAQGTMDELKKDLGRTYQQNTKITIRTIEPIPDITHADIIRIEYLPDRTGVTVEAESDLREYISSVLFESGVRIKELDIEEPSLEEIFMSIYKK